MLSMSILMFTWFIIDDIHMFSARLLADIDSRLRTYYKDNYDFACDENKVLRTLSKTRASLTFYDFACDENKVLRP